MMKVMMMLEKVMIVGLMMIMRRDSKEALMDMLENAHTFLEMKRNECKELRKELKALM